MKIERAEILGQNIDPKYFSYTEFSLNKPVDLQLYECEFIVDKEEFVNCLQPIYDECIDELREEDDKYNDFDPPYKGAESYPELNFFINHKTDDFFEFFSTFFIVDLLESCFANEINEKHWIYVVRSFDKISINDNKVYLYGHVYKGVGKTHLLKLKSKFPRDKNPFLKDFFVKIIRFFKKISI